MTDSQPEPTGRPNILDTAPLMADVGRRAASGGAIAVLFQVIKIVLQLATVSILARLLAPEDFGLVAMATAVTGFVGIFTDLGLSAATVQRKEIAQDTVSALFFVNLGVGFAVMLAAIAAAPLAAWVFGDERVKPLVVALSLTIPFVAASVQHRAILQRGMRWITIQWTDILPQFLGAIAAILLAWGTDAGYWALVVQAWVTAFGGLVVLWTACPWRPGLVREWDEVRPALRFGLSLTGSNLLNYAHRQLDNVLIGWRWGPLELGFYTRAYRLFLMPLTVITWPLAGAMVPAMSRLQAEPDRWRALYLTALAGVVFVTAPSTGLLVILGKPIILLLFGTRWLPAVPVFQLLAISMLLQPIYTSGGWIFVSLGRTSDQLRAGIFAAAWFSAAFAVGVRGGAVGMGLAYTCAFCALVPVWMWWATRRTNVGLAAIVGAVWPPISAAVVGLSVCAPRVLSKVELIDTGITAVLFLLIYCSLVVGVYCLNSNWRQMIRPLLRFAGSGLTQRPL